MIRLMQRFFTTSRHAAGFFLLGAMLLAAFSAVPEAHGADDGATASSAVVLTPLPFDMETSHYLLGPQRRNLWFLFRGEKGKGLVFRFVTDSGSGVLKFSVSPADAAPELESSYPAESAGITIPFTPSGDGNHFMKVTLENPGSWKGKLVYRTGTAPPGSAPASRPAPVPSVSEKAPEPVQPEPVKPAPVQPAPVKTAEPVKTTAPVVPAPVKTAPVKTAEPVKTVAPAKPAAVAPAVVKPPAAPVVREQPVQKAAQPVPEVLPTAPIGEEETEASSIPAVKPRGKTGRIMAVIVLSLVFLGLASLSLMRLRKKTVSAGAEEKKADPGPVPVPQGDQPAPEDSPSPALPETPGPAVAVAVPAVKSIRRSVVREKKSAGSGKAVAKTKKSSGKGSVKKAARKSGSDGKASAAKKTAVRKKTVVKKGSS